MKRTSFVVLSVLLALAFLGTGCPRRQAQTPAPAPVQELNVAMGAEPESLDPIAMASSPSATISQHISQTLVFLDVDGTLRPNLAESWVTAPDGLSWTLNLRRNVQFHDGTPFNAEAVKFNLDRFLNPENAAPFRFLIERIINVEVVDEFTLRLHLEKPFAPLLSHLSHAFIGMVSPAALQALPAGDKITLPVGTGPFKIVSWDKGDRIVLERNAAYWGEQPKLTKVVFRFVPEAASRIVMLETGEVQAIMGVPPAEAPRLRENKDLRVVNQTGVRLIYIGINNLRGSAGRPTGSPGLELRHR
ncbi:MAG: Glutathione-binding protein GsiB [Syntrophomonadaceae bacterium]|nr:Glutathione-binding protein GsiB [Bacillota bacterium]